MISAVICNRLGFNLRDVIRIKIPSSSIEPNSSVGRALTLMARDRNLPLAHFI